MKQTNTDLQSHNWLVRAKRYRGFARNNLWADEFSWFTITYTGRGFTQVGTGVGLVVLAWVEQWQHDKDKCVFFSVKEVIYAIEFAGHGRRR